MPFLEAPRMNISNIHVSSFCWLDFLHSTIPVHPPSRFLHQTFNLAAKWINKPPFNGKIRELGDHLLWGLAHEHQNPWEKSCKFHGSTILPSSLPFFHGQIPMHYPNRGPPACAQQTHINRLRSCWQWGSRLKTLEKPQTLDQSTNPFAAKPNEDMDFLHNKQCSRVLLIFHVRKAADGFSRRPRCPLGTAFLKQPEGGPGGRLVNFRWDGSRWGLDGFEKSMDWSNKNGVQWEIYRNIYGNTHGNIWESKFSERYEN